MQRVGEWWMPDGDTYFQSYFDKHGGTHFQTERLEEALLHVGDRKIAAIDVGAHVGMWTDVLSKRFTIVHAFEPTPETFACLEANADERGWRNVTLHNAPVSDVSGQGVMMTGQHRSGNSGSVFMVPGGEMRTVKLDDLFLGRVDFIKIDVEGAEALVIEGAERLLQRCKPVVVVENKKGFAANFGRSHNDVRMLLEGMGASLVARRGADYIFSWRQE